MHDTPHDDVTRPMPWDAEAEKGLLSSMVQDFPAGTLQGLDLVPGEAYYLQAHRAVRGALAAMVEDGVPVDAITLRDRLAAAGTLDEVGGPAAIGEILAFVPTGAHLRHYADIVLEHARRRAIIAAGLAMVTGGYDLSLDLPAVLADAESRLMALHRGEAQAIRPIKEVVGDVIDHLSHIHDQRGHVTDGIPTGFVDLDRTLQGLKPGGMTLVLARPSIGKTSFGMQVVEHAVFDHSPGASALLFTLEMNAEEIVEMLVMRRAGLDVLRLRDGHFAKKDFVRLMAVCETVSGGRLYIDDTCRTIEQLRVRARLAKLKYGIDLILTDYLQLLTSESKKAAQNREREISEISATAKFIAKELSVHHILLAQANQAADQRKHGMPKFGDIRESSSPGADSDNVLALARPGRHSTDDDQPDDTGLVQVLKQRRGPVGLMPPLEWVPHLAAFRDAPGKKLYGGRHDDDDDVPSPEF